MDPILQISNLNIFANEKQLVHDVNFNLNNGEILSIVGESGSGKSITCLSIGQLNHHQLQVKGNIYFEGIDILALNKQQIKSYLGKQIAYIFQEPMTALNPVLTCGYQIFESIANHQVASKSEIKQKVIQLLEKVKLPDINRIYHSYPHQISGGQRQRVMIAMALANNPKLIIADEPTTALDASIQKSIITLLKELVSESQASLIFISHDLALVEQISDHIIVMQQGKIVEHNTAKQLFKNPVHPYTKALLSTKPSYLKSNYYLPTVQDFLNHQINTTKWESKIDDDISVLNIKHIKKSYSKGFFKKDIKQVLSDINFELKQGEIIGIVGESGCGKTTLANIILGLLTQTDGIIEKNENNSIQMVFQDPFSSLNPKISIGDAIIEALLINNIANNKIQAHQMMINLLEEVGLDSVLHSRYPHELSGGQRQRVCIARAISVKPSILICDESVSALDVSVQSQILNLLKHMQVKKQLSMLFISHDLNVIGYISDRILILKNGQIEEFDKTENIFNHPKSEYTKFLISCMP